MERRAIDERNAAERINSDDSCTDAGEHRLGETAAFVELLIGRDELVALLLELRGHAIKGARQCLKIARAFDTPLLYNYAPGGRSPLLPIPALRALGYALVLLPIDTLLVATKAMAEFLGELRRGDDVRALADRYFPFADFNALIGATEQMALADRYAQ